ncbi:MAG: peptidylprolyl isomerase [Magnetococcales bacterium]|nr:peptidylprolyl isomerase [Magnetococcales bacterium]
MDKTSVGKPVSWSGVNVLAGLALVWSVGAVGAAEIEPAVKSQSPFAKVGSVVIEAEAFFDAVRVGIRQKFYHGTVPLEQRAALQREVGNSLVDNLLLVQEARRRKLVPDQEFVDRTVADYEKKNEKNPEWQTRRESLLPLLVQQLQEQSLLRQLETSVRALPEPDLKALQAYYQAHPDKFTEPMDQKTSVILLSVAPSAGGEAWKAAHEKAEELVKQLKAGADFAEMARTHSGDASARQGGKMDYSHKGMLAPEAEKALEKIPVGAVTDPVMVLEGVAIFRLDDRIPPKLVPFQEAQKRIRSLLVRETADLAWETLKKRLREQTPVSINEEYYLPLPKPGTTNAHPVAGETRKPGSHAP